PALEETLDAVVQHGIHVIQLSAVTMGWNELPDAVPPADAQRLRHALAQRGMELAAVSGTFNMIHPDEKQRREGIRRLGVLLAACQELGASLVTLCTGTRDPQSMWRFHPDNHTSAAWRDLLASMEKAVCAAQAHGITLAVEPEVSNVVCSAARARRLLDEVNSPRLKVCIDAANLFQAGMLPRMREVLREAFDLLANDIVLAHAKDLSRDGAAGDQAAGTGLLDYPFYLSLLRNSGYQGPLILHSLREEEVSASVAFLRRLLP
ncbi:MAG: sugar phosphate isomerase/epimerase family protein, partial [Armatimonadota bacterium]|nr:sugar phosphate isomerase/epimerase family protein [Armatimonadota bacterium]